MRLRDLIATVLGNLRRMRLKLVLTTLGVVIGTASVVLMVSIGAGLQNNIEKTFERYNIATLITVYTNDQGMPVPTPGGDVGSSSRGKKVKPLDDKALREIEAIPGVVAALPRVAVNVGMVSLGDKQFGTQVFGVPPGSLEAFGVKVEQGRAMSGQNEMVVGKIVPAVSLMQMQQGGSVVDPYSDDAPKLEMLGKRLTMEFMPMTPAAGPNDAPPETVRKKMLVTGILSTSEPNTDSSVFVSLKVARKYNATGTRKLVYQDILVKTKSAAATKDVTEQINALGLMAQGSGNEVEGIKQVFVIIQLVLGGIGGIALLVASLGIANTMTMSIYERTREIGIMKAVGASGVQIRQIFLGEAASIGLLGGIGGLALSLGISSLANLFLKQAMTGTAGGLLSGEDLFFVSGGLAIFAVVFATCIGLLAGILPAIRAANLDPLTALRHE